LADRKFKDTEVGRIPVDWEVKRLGEVSSSITDGTHATPRYVDDGIPFYSVENVTENNFSDTKYISEDEHKKLIKRCKPEKGDVLLTRIGTLGKTKLIDWDVNASIYVSLALIKVNNNKVDVNYLYRYSKSSMFVENVKKRSLLNAVPQKINMEDIGDIPLPLPPLLEQKAIAKVLSDVDELIESIEKLIRKKKQIKEGAMQELLTGKKRLAGFSGEWEVKRLGELGVTYSGLSGKKKEDFNNGNSYYITFLNVLNNPVIDLKQVEKVRVSKWENQNLVRKGDIFFNTSSETPEEVGMCSVLMEDKPNLYLNSFCFGYRLYDGSKCDALYLTSYLRSDLGRKMFSTIAQGSTRYNLSKKEFNNIAIPLPPLPEQKAIAQILSDMDAEIEALEKKLDKYRKIKEGMMEKLLTGQVRLV